MAKPTFVIRHKNSEGEFTPAGCIWAEQRGMNLTLSIKVGDEFLAVTALKLENGDEFDTAGFFNIYFNGTDEAPVDVVTDLMQTQIQRNKEWEAKKSDSDWG